MKYMSMNMFRIFAIFSACTALLWSCTIEDADTDTDYAEDLKYYSSVLKRVVMDETLRDGMEAMLQLNTYVGLSDQERSSGEWQDYAKDVSISGNEVTLSNYIVNVKDGVLLMQEGAEWEIDVKSSSYISYYWSVIDETSKALHLTVKCVGDSTWTVSGELKRSSMFDNLEFSAKCTLSSIEYQGLVTTKARKWTVDDMIGSTSEDSGYSSKFNASDGYHYVVSANGTMAESGEFAVVFFKDGHRFASTDDMMEE